MAFRVRSIARWLARAAIIALFGLSLTLTLVSMRAILRDPLIKPMVERTAAEFEAALARETARTATPSAVAARLSTLLDETPRNWIVIEAVENLAADRGIALSQTLTDHRATLWDEDSHWLVAIGNCATCSWDAATCTLPQALVCNAPVTLSPIGDVIGLSKAGFAAVTGSEIDKLDFALSAIGLGATVAAVATGGTSLTLKAGASLLKLAHKMSLLPPRLLALILDVARTGVRWDEVLRWDSVTDPARLLNPEIVRPLAEISSDLGRVSAKLGPTETLHLLRFVDTPEDARHLAKASETGGAKVTGRLEILGKSRFMRAALRWSDTAIALICGLVGLLLSLAMALAGMIQTVLSRALRKTLRATAR